jgi:protein-tyrosine phosphatase
VTESRPTWRRHPIVLALRRAARTVVWTLRRARIANPPLPAHVRSVLFVCKGNICRSPFAAFHADRVARELGPLTVTNASAGLEPSQANACPPDAVTAAAAYGYDMSRWRPLRLTDDLMAAHDLIVVMEARQLEAVRRRWPAHRAKTVLLSLFGPVPNDAWARLNIADPFGRSSEAFDACYTRIDLALRDLFSQVRESAGRREIAD